MIEVELNACPADRRAAEPLPDIDDPAFGAMFDRYRRRAGRAARRGEPRHERILSRARGDFAAADRAARVQYRRGRGGLARRGDDRPVRSSPAMARRRASRVRALPDLDVAQRRGRRVHPLDARAQSAAALRADVRILRPGSLQSERFDARGHRLPRGTGPGPRPTGAPPLRLPEPWAEEPQLYGRNALLEGYARCEVGVHADAKGPAAEADRLLRTTNATSGSTRRRTRGS